MDWRYLFIQLFESNIKAWSPIDFVWIGGKLIVKSLNFGNLEKVQQFFEMLIGGACISLQSGVGNPETNLHKVQFFTFWKRRFTLNDPRFLVINEIYYFNRLRIILVHKRKRLLWLGVYFGVASNIKYKYFWCMFVQYIHVCYAMLSFIKL